MDLKECYETMGGSVDGVLGRLKTEERIVKYLVKFVDDRNFSTLECRLKEGDDEEAFRAAHSLKGICMNLELRSLQSAAIDLTENLRGGKADQETQNLFERTKEEYQKTVSAVGQFMGSQRDGG